MNQILTDDQIKTLQEQLTREMTDESVKSIKGLISCYAKLGRSEIEILELISDQLHKGK